MDEEKTNLNEQVKAEFEKRFQWWAKEHCPDADVVALKAIAWRWYTFGRGDTLKVCVRNTEKYMVQGGLQMMDEMRSLMGFEYGGL